MNTKNQVKSAMPRAFVHHAHSGKNALLNIKMGVLSEELKYLKSVVTHFLGKN